MAKDHFTTRLSRLLDQTGLVPCLCDDLLGRSIVHHGVVALRAYLPPHDLIISGTERLEVSEKNHCKLIMTFFHQLRWVFLACKNMDLLMH